MTELVRAIDSLENLSLNCSVEEFPIEAIRKHGPGMRSLCLREYDGIVYRPLRQSRYCTFRINSFLFSSKFGSLTTFFREFPPLLCIRPWAARQSTQANPAPALKFVSFIHVSALDQAILTQNFTQGPNIDSPRISRNFVSLSQSYGAGAGPRSGNNGKNFFCNSFNSDSLRLTVGSVVIQFRKPTYRKPESSSAYNVCATTLS